MFAPFRRIGIWLRLCYFPHTQNTKIWFYQSTFAENSCWLTRVVALKPNRVLFGAIKPRQSSEIKLESLVEQRETAEFSVGRSQRAALLTVHAIAGPTCSKENKNSCWQNTSPPSLLPHPHADGVTYEVFCPGIILPCFTAKRCCSPESSKFSLGMHSSAFSFTAAVKISGY